MSGVVYFARCGGDGPIKIGFTQMPLAARISFLQVGCPWPIELLATIEGAEGEERRMHGLFAASHMRGEWFYPTKDLIEFIASVAVPVPAEVPAADPLDIRAVRAELGLSQMAFAEALGVHQSTVSAWEVDGPPKRAPAIKAILHLVADHRARLAA